IEVPVANLVNQPLAAVSYAVDADGNRSFQHNAQVREIYMFGGTGETSAFQGSMVLGIDGTLAIGSDQSPRINLLSDSNARAVQVTVKQAPTGAGITVALHLGSTLWMMLTIPAGQTFVQADASQIAGAATITGLTNMRQDITAVGTMFPGADLTTQ